nr:MAG TPA: hypothetical protein [Caudoviricetes sp.]
MYYLAECIEHPDYGFQIPLWKYFVLNYVN